MLRGAAIKKSIILSTAIFIFFCCIPLHINADSPTYIEIEPNETALIFQHTNGTNKCYATPNKDCRAVILNDGNNTNYLYTYFVCDEPFSVTFSNDGVSVWGNTTKTQNIANNGYYLIISNRLGAFDTYSKMIPYVNVASSATNAIYYTFGDGAIGPQPVINYGELIDLGYYTNFTNSQQSNYLQMRNNKDNISWNGYEDSNGNQINTIDYQVEIQAYATEYEAQTKQGLLGLTLTDLQNYGTPVTIYEGSANRGEFTILWGDVADALNGTSTTIDFWSQMAPHSYENMWYSHGWLYRIRLKTSDESYVGNWQTIYTMASAPPQDAETVYNYYYYYGGQGISDDVVDVLYNINTSNNTSNVWYINNNQVDPSGGSANWLEILLKFISDMIGKIIDLFGNMFDSVLDFLLNLFDGFDPVGTFTGWWERLKQLFNGIDLTLPSFNLPESDISSFSILVQKTLEILTLNGLGFIIFIPLIVMIVRLFL